MAKSYTHIVVATDGSACAQAASNEAARLARALGSRITLVYVFDPVKYALPEGYVPYTPEQFSDMTAHFDAMLKRERERLISNGVADVETRLLQGVPNEELNTYAATNDVSLFVIGTHGRGVLSRMLLGSTAENLVRSASIPVLTVRHPEG
jgi:nucleotide-binding universal stress UspA family protein